MRIFMQTKVLRLKWGAKKTRRHRDACWYFIVHLALNQPHFPRSVSILLVLIETWSQKFLLIFIAKAEISCLNPRFKKLTFLADSVSKMSSRGSRTRHVHVMSLNLLTSESFIHVPDYRWIPSWENRTTFASLYICANAQLPTSTSSQSLKNILKPPDISYDQYFCKDLHWNSETVNAFPQMLIWRNAWISEWLNLKNNSLSMLSIRRCIGYFEFPERIGIHSLSLSLSLSLPLSLHWQTVWIQIGPEYKTERLKSFGMQ